MPTLTHSSGSDRSLRRILYAAARATQPKGGKRGEAPPRAPPPPFPSRHSAVRVPRNEMSKGAADTWGMAAAFPPDAPPLRAVVATRRRRQQLLIVNLVPVSDANCQYENVRAPLQLNSSLPRV